MKAIDVHGHFGKYDRGFDSLNDKMMSGSAEVMSRRGQALDIVLTVVSALRALIPYGGDVQRGNEEAVAAAEQFANIKFWAVLDPCRKETYSQVESLLAHPRCKGIKIHPVEHSYEIRQYGDAVFEFAAAHQTVVLTHSGDPGSFPEDFVPFANRYPGMSLILAHLGNSPDGVLARQVLAVKAATAGNLYIDTSSARSIFSGLVEWAVGEIGAEKLLFGTDGPLYFSASQKARIEYAEIDEAAKRAILFDNAAKLLKETNL
ncbi:MAG: hypothetical protein EXR62_17700 [Chloroflexi bacterium]|nr:hypothetical protein [Chloroflexota bacterium]